MRVESTVPIITNRPLDWISLLLTKLYSGQLTSVFIEY